MIKLHFIALNMQYIKGISGPMSHDMSIHHAWWHFTWLVCLLVEAEYTFQMRKEYIPLMVQKRYRPDGWLGMILGAKLYFDFSGKYPFEKPWNGLMKELKGMGRLSVLENNALGQYMSTGVNVYRCTCLQVYMNMSVSLLGVKRWKWLSVLYWRFFLFSFWCEIISQPVRNSVMFNLIVTLL